MKMKRTQLYLPPETHYKIAREAELQHTTMAEVMRQYIEMGVEGKLSTRKQGAAHLLSLAKRVHARGIRGPKDLAENLDEYLYKSRFK